MILITTHTNADFDTLAGLVAAEKLHPGAVLSFPGALEKELTTAIERLGIAEKFTPPDNVPLEKVTRLVLVDTQGPSRIGRFKELIGKPGLEVCVYDHHPENHDTVEASVKVIRPYGSTATVLTLLLKERGIGLTPAEASIVLSGIYEDTGSLSFSSVKKEDFDAAGFLVSLGADVSLVTGLLKKELTAEDVETLERLMKASVSYDTGGVEVVVAHMSGKYSGDLASLASRLMEIGGMEALALLAEAGKTTHAVMRSKTSAFNAGKAAEALGGGGHPQAASASLKGMTLVEAREALLKALGKGVTTAAIHAADIMSAPAVTVAPNGSMAEASRLMTRYGLNALPVVTPAGRVEGIVTRQVAERALYHGLGNEQASHLMTTGVECVDAGTTAEKIRSIVMGYGQRLLPVVKDGKLVGVITRTDVLKLLQEDILFGAAAKKGARKKLIANVMRERLPSEVFTALKEAGEAAAALGFNAYAVGGFVRDMLLGRPNLDVDVVIEGDGISFAREFGKRFNAHVKTHERFKTAVVTLAGGLKLDVATARLEYYEHPGALPTVERASLKLDLYRRDFTINTLAAALNPGARFGELIDFFGAESDIKTKTVRVLHNLSFVEDPTRAIRAVRFAERFGFSIEDHTLRLLKNAVRLGMLERISGARIFEELRRTLGEERAADAARLMHELGILRSIHGLLAWDKKCARVFERTHDALAWHRLLYSGDRIEGWLVYFLALTDRLGEKELHLLAKKLSVSGRHRIEAVEARRRGQAALGVIASGRAKKGSEVHALLNPLPLEVTLYLMAKTEREATRKTISDYITRLKDMRPAVTGSDLKTLGVKEGPRMGKILKEILKKQLDGEVSSKEEELSLAKKLLK